MTAVEKPRRADQIKRNVRFSICTLVTDRTEYDDMVRSFRKGGFTGEDCEYLYLDNTDGNTFDAFSGGNTFLLEAAGDFIIICHQDVILLEDNRETLERRLTELEDLHPDWGACGNAGGTKFGEIAVRISDPYGEDQKVGAFPSRVAALDENFIVVRRAANLALSDDLRGFHLYGADLCINAEILGHSSWVIDFHLRHKSRGRRDASFFSVEKAMIKKYRRAFRSRPISTTCTQFVISSHKLPTLIGYLRRTWRYGRLT